MNDLNLLHSKRRPFLRRIVLFFFIFVPIILWTTSLFLEIAVNQTPLPKSLFSDLNGTPVLLDREGKIIAQGSHQELLQKSETYKNFYEKQLRKD